MISEGNPIVSVVLCEHNTPIDYLEEALNSVLNQTYGNFEIIFVDDASSTNYSSLAAFRDSRVKVIKNSANKGLGASRNIGIDNSKGKYIAIMDTDDIALPERFSKQVQFLENNPDVAVCGTWFETFGEKFKIIKRVIDDNEYYRCCLFFDNDPTVINPSTMIRKSVLIENKIRLNEQIKSAEDYDLWTKISCYGKVTNIKEVLFKYRLRPNQMSQRFRTKDISDNGWVILKWQLEKLKVDLSEEEIKLIRLNYLRKEVDPIKYFKLLDKLSVANQISHFYVQEKFDKRIRVQWKNKIYSIKNIFVLLKLLFALPFKEKKYLIKVEFERLNRKKIKSEENKEIQICE